MSARTTPGDEAGRDDRFGVSISKVTLGSRGRGRLVVC